MAEKKVKKDAKFNRKDMAKVPHVQSSLVRTFFRHDNMMFKSEEKKKYIDEYLFEVGQEIYWYFPNNKKDDPIAAYC